MNLKKTILSATAFLIGVVSLVGVCVGAYRELHGGLTGVVPVLILFILAVAALLLLFPWLRDIAGDPATVPAAIF